MPSGRTRYGGIYQERQPLMLHAPQCLGDIRQRDVPRDDVFGEIAIDRLGVGWRRVLAGEAEQGRGEHVLGERSNESATVRASRESARAVRRADCSAAPATHRVAPSPSRDRSCSASRIASGAGSRSVVPIERGDDLRHRVCGRHAVSLAPGVHSAHGCVEGGDRAHDDPDTDPRER